MLQVTLAGLRVPCSRPVLGHYIVTAMAMLLAFPAVAAVHVPCSKVLEERIWESLLLASPVKLETWRPWRTDGRWGQDL